MRPSALRRSITAAVVAAVAVGSLSPAFAEPGKRRGPKPKAPKPPTDYAPACVGNPDDVQYLELLVNGQKAWGFYAMPATRPKGIVVFAHGYGHTAYSWREHVARTARENGVVAVAMNYRGQIDSPGNPRPTSRGWQVQEGAEDSIAVAQMLERACPTAKTIVMYGVSMGGNTAGLAVAAKAKRRNGSPLFDYWFDIEGAVNVTETYHEARALAGSGNAFAVNAVEDIEREMGGTFEEKTDVYLDRTVVTRADDIKASGIKGVVMVHGVDDGLVGYNQTPEMYTRLRALGVPVDFWTALTQDNNESGTTLDGYVTGNVPGFPSIFAGHASEVSTTHVVGAAGFQRLAALFRGEAPDCRTGLIDGNAGFTAAGPATSPGAC